MKCNHILFSVLCLGFCFVCFLPSAERLSGLSIVRKLWQLKRSWLAGHFGQSEDARKVKGEKIGCSQEELSRFLFESKHQLPLRL